jgi:hypothetical protein
LTSKTGVFRRAEAGVDERFAQIEPAPVAQVLGQPLENVQQPAGALPVLKPTMTGLVGRVARRQIVPRRAGA